jgi:hypothetical protein
MKTSICSEKQSDIKSMKVNNLRWLDLNHKKAKMLHEFEELYRVQNLVLNLFDLFLC